MRYFGGMDVKKLKDDFRAGRIGGEQLITVIESLAKRVAELEKKLGVAAGEFRVELPFSLRAEEKRQEARGKIKRPKKRSGRRGRVTTAEKIKLAQRTEKCFPVGVAESDCRLSHTRVVWRLEGGQAVLVAYEIHRAPDGRYEKSWACLIEANSLSTFSSRSRFKFIRLGYRLTKRAK